MLSVQPFCEDLEFITPNFVNRYVIADEKHVYLLNGAEMKDYAQPFGKLSPCERVSLRTKQAEKVDACIFIDPAACALLSNDDFLFYLGKCNACDISATEAGGLTNMPDEDDFILVQVLNKSTLKWTQHVL